MREIAHHPFHHFVKQVMSFISAIETEYIFFKISVKVLFGTHIVNTPEPILKKHDFLCNCSNASLFCDFTRFKSIFDCRDL